MNFLCPHCRQSLSSDGLYPNRAAQCPYCSGYFLAPDVSPAIPEPPPVPAHLVCEQQREASYVPQTRDGVLILPGKGTFNVDVVGESHFQKQLEYVCGGKCERGADLDAKAILCLEDDNPFDSKAVIVTINGYPVGYLRREYARRLRGWLTRLNRRERALECNAHIAGGWYRSEFDQGHFGVVLDIWLREKV